jgi:hypothetical protein
MKYSEPVPHNYMSIKEKLKIDLSQNEMKANMQKIKSSPPSNSADRNDNIYIPPL